MFSDPLGRSVVGPAPWYWETFPILGEGYEWRFIPRSGSSYPDGEPVLFGHRATSPEALALLRVRIYGRVIRPKEGHVLLWGPRVRHGDLIIETFALDDLRPIDVAAPADDETPWRVSAEALDRVTIPEGLPAGRAPDRYVAHAASGLQEILLLADGPSAEAATSIYAWHPGEGTVDVMPQTWLRQDTHDLGYQWITRVARHGRRGRIHGDGIRLAPFELDADGTSMRRMPLWRQAIGALRHQR